MDARHAAGLPVLEGLQRIDGSSPPGLPKEIIESWESPYEFVNLAVVMSSSVLEAYSVAMLVLNKHYAAYLTTCLEYHSNCHSI